MSSWDLTGGTSVPVPNYAIYASSTEYVPFTVSVSGTINPTSGSVSMAFLTVPPPTQPTAGQFVVGSWQGAVSPYVALCLVSGTASAGGGAATLSANLWYAWLKLSFSPETPVKYAGVLQVS
jgi:hypothetical protein